MIDAGLIVAFCIGVAVGLLYAVIVFLYELRGAIKSNRSKRSSSLDDLPSKDTEK